MSYDTMKQKTCIAFFCFSILLRPIICKDNFIKFEKVSSFKGEVLLTKSTWSVFSCLADCVHQKTSCRGASYNEGSHECKLLNTETTSSAPSTTFYAEADWVIHLKVMQCVIKQQQQQQLQQQQLQQQQQHITVY